MCQRTLLFDQVTKTAPQSDWMFYLTEELNMFKLISSELNLFKLSSSGQELEEI
jgi:hypothetical protein